MRHVLPALAPVLLLVAAGCSGHHEENTRDQIALYDDLNEALDTVRDDASLEAALPKLRELNAEFQALREQRELDPKLPKGERGKGIARHGETLRRQSEMFGLHVRRILESETISKEKADRLFEAIQDLDPES